MTTPPSRRSYMPTSAASTTWTPPPRTAMVTARKSSANRCAGGESKIYVGTKIFPTRWPSHRRLCADDARTIPGMVSAPGSGEIAAAARRGSARPTATAQLDGRRRTGFSTGSKRSTNCASKARSTRSASPSRDYRPEEGVDLARLGLVSSIQVVFDLFDQRPAGALFEAAEQSGTACIARVPLDSGSLTGAWTADTYDTWAPGIRAAFAVPRPPFRRNSPSGRGTEEGCPSPYYANLAEAAMRYALSPPQSRP